MGSEEIARSLEGSDLKWMREASKYLIDGNGGVREKATCHYAIPLTEYKSLALLKLVQPGTVLLTQTGREVAALLGGIPSPTGAKANARLKELESRNAAA